jgi:hypothetical protein
MGDIGSILLGLVTGIMLGLVILFFYIRYKITQISGNFDNLIREAIREVEAEMVGVNVEKHNGVFFAYRETDNQFVAQANTVEELRAAFKVAFPNKITYLAGGDAAVVNEVKAALETAK